MESLGRVFTSGVSAIVSPFFSPEAVVDDEDISVDDEASILVQLPAPAVPADELDDDWMVVVEDHATVNAFPITDVHPQRVSPRRDIDCLISTLQTNSR
jgi:hypothetical protein